MPLLKRRPKLPHAQVRTKPLRTRCGFGYLHDVCQLSSIRREIKISAAKPDLLNPRQRLAVASTSVSNPARFQKWNINAYTCRLRALHACVKRPHARSARTAAAPPLHSGATHTNVSSLTEQEPRRGRADRASRGNRCRRRLPAKHRTSACEYARLTDFGSGPVKSVNLRGFFKPGGMIPAGTRRAR